MTAIAALSLAGMIQATVPSHSAPAPAPAVADVPVQRVTRACFVRAIHATGYIVPRETAVVIFGAPDFRLSDVSAKPGDRVTRGDVVARAASTARKSGDAVAVPIRSLASGVVIASSAFPGQPVDAPAEPLFTIAVDGVMEALLDIPATHAFDLVVGQTVHVSLRDGTVVDGRVRLPPLTIDAKSQVAQARIAFEATAHPTPGRFIRATIDASRTCGLGVPQAALMKTSGGTQVLTVADGLVAARPVVVGIAGNTDIEVTSGLGDGDLVVANAGAAVHDGDRVNPVFTRPPGLP